MKTFATEEDKNKAIDDFDERKGTEADLDEIMNAEIGTPETSTDDVVDVVVVPPTEEPKPEVTLTESTVDQTITEKTTPDDVAILKQQLLEKEQYIKENLSNISNIRALEEKVSLLSQAQQTPETKQEKKESTLRESRLSELKERKKKLIERFPDPEQQLDSDYIIEMNAIQDGFFDEFEILQNNISVAHEQANNAVKKSESYYVQKEEDAAKSRYQDAITNEEKEVEKFSKKHPEFTMTKSLKEVDADYKEYQKEVAKVYFGKETVSPIEASEAMAQLKRNSPGLMAKLRASNVPTTLSGDMVKLLGLCETWDYWTAYRKDPITGDYHRDKNGNIIQLTRYEPKTGTYIPDYFPGMEEAYNDKAAKEGYYTKQVLSAKIEGGKQAISAINRRDSGAVELGVNETSGGQQQALDEVYKKINEMDEKQIIMSARAGDNRMLNEYNSMAKAIGWPEIETII
ncbi:MAG TPA: hypothetical protein VMV77_09245 [Bacteroidales bacterium]|nr:hypothetical protein [Bacteroidales bacterium]